MGRLSRALRRVVSVAAPIAFPALAPLAALSARRAAPPPAPEDVAVPTSSGGFLPAMIEGVQRARGRGRAFVQEEIAPLVEGTPFEIVDTEDEELEDEDVGDEDIDEDEPEDRE